jgi:hypothetical protein
MALADPESPQLNSLEDRLRRDSINKAPRERLRTVTELLPEIMSEDPTVRVSQASSNGSRWSKS